MSLVSVCRKLIENREKMARRNWRDETKLRLVHNRPTLTRLQNNFSTMLKARQVPNAEKCQLYRERLKLDPQRYEMQRMKSIARNARNRRLPKTEEQLQRMREKSRLRTQKYRARMKAEQQAILTLMDLSNAPVLHQHHKPQWTEATSCDQTGIASQRQKWAADKRAERLKWSEEQWQRHRDLSRRFYRQRKSKLKQESVAATSLIDNEHCYSVSDDSQVGGTNRDNPSLLASSVTVKCETVPTPNDPLVDGIAFPSDNLPINPPAMLGNTETSLPSAPSLSGTVSVKCEVEESLYTSVEDKDQQQSDSKPHERSLLTKQSTELVDNAFPKRTNSKYHIRSLLTKRSIALVDNASHQQIDSNPYTVFAIQPQKVTEPLSSGTSLLHHNMNQRTHAAAISLLPPTETNLPPKTSVKKNVRKDQDAIEKIKNILFGLNKSPAELREFVNVLHQAIDKLEQVNKSSTSVKSRTTPAPSGVMVNSKPGPQIHYVEDASQNIYQPNKSLTGQPVLCLENRSQNVHHIGKSQPGQQILCVGNASQNVLQPICTKSGNQILYAGNDSQNAQPYTKSGQQILLAKHTGQNVLQSMDTNTGQQILLAEKAGQGVIKHPISIASQPGHQILSAGNASQNIHQPPKSLTLTGQQMLNGDNANHNKQPIISSTAHKAGHKQSSVGFLEESSQDLCGANSKWILVQKEDMLRDSDKTVHRQKPSSALAKAQSTIYTYMQLHNAAV